jgi:N6-adenosine-specific RNA methylase IME4
VRDRVGSTVGLGGSSYVRAKAVIAAAEADPQRYGPLVEAMDASGRVAGVFRRLRTMQQAEALNAEPPPLPTGPFDVVACDPPWQYTHRPGDDSKRNVTPYPAMSLDELKALPVAELAARDCALWLWTTNAHLPDAVELVKAWGFEWKTMLTWAKDRIGTGDLLRGQTEHAVLAVRGRPILTLAGQSTLLRAARGEHSAKPEEFYALVESLCPGSKVELFARRRRPGWTAWGGPELLDPVANGDGHAAGNGTAAKAGEPVEGAKGRPGRRSRA